jgi:alpha,alpha-trehalose-phosphate synthase [UDP-forming]
MTFAAARVWMREEVFMPLKRFSHVSKALQMALPIAGAAGLLISAMVGFQIEHERRVDMEDVDRRAALLSQRLSEPAVAALELEDAEAKALLGPRVEGYHHLIGLAVYRPDGRPVAQARSIALLQEALSGPVTRVLTEQRQASEVTHVRGARLHMVISPLKGPDQTLRGALAIVHDLSYLDERATSKFVQSVFWIGMVTLLLITPLVAGAAWITYEKPLYRLAEWMRRQRQGYAPEAPPSHLPQLLASESNRLFVSLRAARSSSRALSRAAVREDNLWTRDRLRSHVIDSLRGGQLIVLSNREPYMHQFRDGKPKVIIPAGGLVTALDPILQACGGVWIAHGAGEADRATADPQGRLTVPPKNGRYTLRRVWLSRAEEQGYYYGFANEGLWPLCHLAHERPLFRAADWAYYIEVNRRFADMALEEVGSGEALVLVQDYHLALVPGLLKAARPDLRVGIFWHIPWPHPDTFRICPWGTEILQGMLGADIIGFHLQQYCNNFLDTVDRMIEARLDWDHFAIELKGNTSRVKPFPISVESWSERDTRNESELEQQIQALKEEYKLEGVQIAVGVDRIDYTKGLPERFRAIERFLEKYPEYRGRFTFVQLGAPSRTHLRRYRDLINELESMADEINWRFQTNGWKPIRLLVAHHDAVAVHPFLTMASICIVSSLHDGMNLVAKEYVSAQTHCEGVLVLSEFAGAAGELSAAVIVNPYDTEQFAEGIREAIVMEPAERRARMEHMRRVVEERNIYRWAANFLTNLSNTRASAPQATDIERIPTSGPSSPISAIRGLKSFQAAKTRRLAHDRKT